MQMSTAVPRETASFDTKSTPPPRRQWYRVSYYYAPRGYYSHFWLRGERLPYSYYDEPYYVRDYWS